MLEKLVILFEDRYSKTGECS